MARVAAPVPDPSIDGVSLPDRPPIAAEELGRGVIRVQKTVMPLPIVPPAFS